MLRNLKRRFSVGKIKKRIVGEYNGDHVSLSRKLSSIFCVNVVMPRNIISNSFCFRSLVPY